MRARALRCVLIGFCFSVLNAPAQESDLARGESLLREGKPGDALAVFLELYRTQPLNPNLCQQIGVAYTQLADFKNAEQYYRKAVRIDPKFHAARKNLGTVLWFLSRKNESEQEFRMANKTAPTDPVPHLYLGLAAHGRRDFLSAKTHFEKAGPLASANPEVLPAVLETYLAVRDLSLPDRVFQQLTSADNPDPALTSRAGAIFAQYGYHDRAAAAYEKLIAAHKDSAETWQMLAQAYDRQGKAEQAYRAYSRGIDMDPAAEDSYIALAEFASAHQNNDYGLEVVGRGLKRLTESPKLLLEQGILWALKGDRAKAEASFRDASRAKPDWGLPLLAIGVSQLESGDVASAASMFQKARSADVRDYRAHYLYAVALSRASDADSAPKRAQAITVLRKSIELNPKDARSHALLGSLYLAAGDANAAGLAWQKTLKIDPQNSTALYQLGLLYRKQGKAQEAERMMQAFRRVKASQRESDESLVQILRVVPAARAQ